jgi:DNA-binding beta-propeller fold protein YncE
MMKHANTVALMLGVAGVALVAMSSDRTYSQANDPNGAPNPYKLEDNWAQLPAGRKIGSTIGIEADKDGKSIWVFDRCGANNCANSPLNPIQKFDANGKFVTSFGANVFNQPHGLGVDRDGNVYASDQTPNNGRGAVVVKFSPAGQILMVLGHLGQPGNGRGFLSMPTDVAIAPNGDIYVTDGHGGASNDRIMKYSKDGNFIATWGKRGKGQGEFDGLHAIALDSAGRVYVGDRVNGRVQVFESDGKFVAEWKQFGRPSGIVIDKNDMIYVADTQSNPTNNPGFKQGIRIGSVKDGKVTAFIPEPSAEIGSPEGIGVDDAGAVYAGWTGKMNFRRFVKN